MTAKTTLPKAALVEAVRVRAAVPPGVTTAGAIVAVTPDGRPLTASETFPLNPPVPVTLIREVVDPPAASVSAVGTALIVNPGLTAGGACVTLKEKPPTMMLAVRDDVVVLAATE